MPSACAINLPNRQILANHAANVAIKTFAIAQYIPRKFPYTLRSFFASGFALLSPSHFLRFAQTTQDCAMRFLKSPLVVAISTALLSTTTFGEPHHSHESADTSADDTLLLSPLIVTDTAMTSPVTVTTDLKVPRQPVPTHDGADYLKTIPGFAVTRKGGSDGDPVFRGMTGSRLGIAVDGETLLGGCNSRMDAPTAYIYPELYDKLTVVKGPQTVSHGPMSSAATILFEREVEPFDVPDYRLRASALAASASRYDELIDLRAGAALGYFQLTGSNSQAHDYEDGNGDKVHSEYHRYGGQFAAGYTPDRDTRIEASVNHSNGEAAYADRGMDGTRFLRESQNLKVEKRNISETLNSVEFQVYGNEIDHVMDDQKLRKPGMMGYSNLKRNTEGGRFATTFVLTGNDLLSVGYDQQNNSHEARNAGVNHVYSKWSDDASFQQKGLFAEYQIDFSEGYRVVTGYRADRWEATDKRKMIGSMMGHAAMNPTAGETRRETLGGGFARIERELSERNTTLYAGIGRAERFPDYWELISKRGDGSISGFHTDVETTTQLDLGALYSGASTDLAASVFYANIDDFILVDYTSMMAMNGYSRNVDARTYGGELSSTYRMGTHWQMDSSLAWTWGENRTDNAPLPQTPPLEARLGLAYSHADWSVGGLVRGVRKQSRYDDGRGTIVGKDLGPSSGFAVFSLNTSWKARPDTQLSAGIDNLFDRTYSEFVSRSGGDGMGGAIAGYVQTDRVNEPGRTFWARVQVDL
ncbi:tonb-dependent copper receptor [gamma proteobacterium HdN1]|nr:tonb-dependent copper receptor [gamma proteobacterium HdN1]